ncbi:MAG: MoxR family ATPase [Deltaproteobacteria bacterium]|nr:MAG: MoxR family ATPase [Deltaproteobacteria bacterium]
MDDIDAREARPDNTEGTAAQPAGIGGTRDGVEEMLGRAASARDRIVEQLGRRVFGQEEVVEHLLISLFARGHTLMMGVPGLAKTLLVSTLAQALRLDFNRIQFTPDLMPADITGTDILEVDADGSRHMRFLQGPVFCNLLLADEINRTPPKTQAALLQAMQERRVTVGGRTYSLEPPFLVFATQNPIEQEGTYPLPEAQLDRFMFHIHVDYPSYDDEVRIATATTGQAQEPVEAVLGPEEILEVQRLVLAADVDPAVARHAVELVRATRPSDDAAPADIRRYTAFGAGPRATQFLILGAKARAVLKGYEAPSVEDVRAIAHPVLRHRILVNFQAEADGVDADRLIDTLLDTFRP